MRNVSYPATKEGLYHGLFLSRALRTKKVIKFPYPSYLLALFDISNSS